MNSLYAGTHRISPSPSLIVRLCFFFFLCSRFSRLLGFFVVVGQGSAPTPLNSPFFCFRSVLYCSVFLSMEDRTPLYFARFQPPGAFPPPRGPPFSDSLRVSSFVCVLLFFFSHGKGCFCFTYCCLLEFRFTAVVEESPFSPFTTRPWRHPAIQKPTNYFRPNFPNVSSVKRKSPSCSGPPSVAPAPV